MTIMMNMLAILMAIVMITVIMMMTEWKGQICRLQQSVVEQYSEHLAEAVRFLPLGGTVGGASKWQEGTPKGPQPRSPMFIYSTPD